MTSQEWVLCHHKEAQILRPRPLQPMWGEVVTKTLILAAGFCSDERLWEMAAQQVSVY